MTLTELRLNPSNPEVRKCLSDSHILHVRVMGLFAETQVEDARATLRVLHRLEIDTDGVIRLIVQSDREPTLSHLPDGFLETSSGASPVTTRTLEGLLKSIEPGEAFLFKLRANPTRKIDTKSTPEGARRNGKRVPLRGDQARVDWLSRKLADSGMTLQALVKQTHEGRIIGGGGTKRKTHEAHIFEGLLTITDAAKAKAAVITGVGPAKAYGFGLLSLSLRT